MKGVNKVIIVGRLGADPEVKAVGSTTNARLNVATSESWTKDGEKQERTEWHRVVVWGKLAEICGKYLKKGSAVYLEGKLQTRSWDDKDTGQKKFSTEIVASTIQFLSTTGAGASGEDSGGRAEKPKKSSGPSFDKPANDEPPFGEDDDLFRLDSDDDMKDF